MNEKRTDMQIIRDILKMGATPEGRIQSQLGLASRDFDRYRTHLVKRGFATETIDPSEDYILQPTPTGQALMRMIDTLESIEDKHAPKASPPAGAETASVSLSPNMTVSAMLMRDRLYQGYVMEQAEVSRLKALLKHEGDEELRNEHRQREEKLNMLQEFLGVFDQMLKIPIKCPGNTTE